MVWSRAGLSAQIYFEGPTAEVNMARFEWLYERREAFEAALGGAAEWDEMPGRKASRVIITSPFREVTARDDWPAITEWLLDAQIRLRAALNAVGGFPSL